MSSATSKGWIVAASIGAVEALKDQGVCRWNHIIRSIHQHAKSKVKSTTTAQTSRKNKKFSSSASTAISSKVREGKMKQREESFRTVVYLSSWGPY